jgi:hypothetical protein
VKNYEKKNKKEKKIGKGRRDEKISIPLRLKNHKR